MSTDRNDTPDEARPGRTSEAQQDGAREEYEDIDADTVTEDAIEYFEDGSTGSPASETSTPPPG
jgi:hypothetical protein